MKCSHEEYELIDGTEWLGCSTCNGIIQIWKCLTCGTTGTTEQHQFGEPCNPIEWEEVEEGTPICVEHGGPFDDNDGKDVCKTCEDLIVTCADVKNPCGLSTCSVCGGEEE